MQLKIIGLLPKIAGSGFKYSTSSVLAGITLVGAFSTVIFNSKNLNGQISSVFEQLQKNFKNSFLYDGIKKTGGTLKNWGITVVSTKDDFKEWLNNYLNASGFKSGVVNLYEKLKDWALIVYTWFREKFLEFISNIPKMVENWRNLRLSLFKWGTFLGGGGGSALWSMFGSGDRWGKLSELMGSPEFGDIAEKFGKLMEDNSGAFASMAQEEVEEILDSFLDDPKEALEATEELLNDQKEKNKDKNEKEELSKEEIQEAYAKAKGGSPKSPEGVFKNMISGGMKALVDFNSTQSFFGGESFDYAAEKEMKKYVEIIKKEAEKEKTKKKEDTPIQQFLKGLDEDKENKLIPALAKSMVKAYKRLNNEKATFEELSTKFATVLEEDFTEECSGDCNGESINLREKIPTSAPKRK